MFSRISLVYRLMLRYGITFQIYHNLVSPLQCPDQWSPGKYVSSSITNAYVHVVVELLGN
jgi:hypothetical protein